MDEIKTYDGELGELIMARLMLRQIQNFMMREHMLDEWNSCENKEKCPLRYRRACSERDVKTAIRCVEKEIRSICPESDVLPENNKICRAHRRVLLRSRCIQKKNRKSDSKT